MENKDRTMQKKIGRVVASMVFLGALAAVSFGGAPSASAQQTFEECVAKCIANKFPQCQRHPNRTGCGQEHKECREKCSSRGPSGDSDDPSDDPAEE